MCANCETWWSAGDVCPQPRIEPHHLPPELSAACPRVRSSFIHVTQARSAYEANLSSASFRTPLEYDADGHGPSLERSHLYRKMKSLGIAAPD